VLHQVGGEVYTGSDSREVDDIRTAHRPEDDILGGDTVPEVEKLQSNIAVGVLCYLHGIEGRP
jgi:hypothetical protein